MAKEEKVVKKKRKINVVAEVIAPKISKERGVKTELPKKTEVVFVPEDTQPITLGAFKLEALKGGYLYELPEPFADVIKSRFGDAATLEGLLEGANLVVEK